METCLGCDRYYNYKNETIYSISKKIKEIEEITGMGVIELNDTKGRTHEDLIQLIKRVELNLGLV